MMIVWYLVVLNNRSQKLNKKKIVLILVFEAYFLFLFLFMKIFMDEWLAGCMQMWMDINLIQFKLHLTLETLYGKYRHLLNKHTCSHSICVFSCMYLFLCVYMYACLIFCVTCMDYCTTSTSIQILVCIFFCLI